MRIYNGKKIDDCSNCSVFHFYDHKKQRDFCRHPENKNKEIDWQDKIDPDCPLPFSE